MDYIKQIFLMFFLIEIKLRKNIFSLLILLPKVNILVFNEIWTWMNLIFGISNSVRINGKGGFALRKARTVVNLAYSCLSSTLPIKKELINERTLMLFLRIFLKCVVVCLKYICRGLYSAFDPRLKRGQGIKFMWECLK